MSNLFFLSGFVLGVPGPVEDFLPSNSDSANHSNTAQGQDILEQLHHGLCSF